MGPFDLQLAMERFVTSDIGRSVVRSCIENSRLRILPEEVLDGAVGARLHELTTDPARVIEAAAFKLPYRAMIASDQVPCPKGVVVFDEVQTWQCEGEPQGVPLRALSWWIYRQPHLSRSWLVLMDWMDLDAVIHLPEGEDRLWKAEDRVEIARGWMQYSPVVPINISALALDEEFGDELPEHLWHDRNYLLSWVLTFFHFLSEVLVTEPLSAPRHEMKRALRAGLPVEESKIVILRRRSRSSSGELIEGQSVEWSHRWIVEGHWRNHWYPSLNSHRPIWVDPYVKGPEDKPLLLKETLYKVSR